MQNRVLNINSIYLKTKLLESLNDLLFCIDGLFAWFCLIRWIISNINKQTKCTYIVLKLQHTGYILSILSIV